ncbi:MAG TPA: PLP-dependent aspartate aminotransferase family protein [Pyrinomonadaceae bacterium]|jgi:cystathionine gamma-synthase/methionine-gamma-lyase
MSEFSIATQFVHAGERRAAPVGVPAAAPIYATSTFVYERMEDVDRVVEGEESGFVYSRYGNPTVAAFEAALAEIENGKFAFAFGSGMAALHAALLACELSSGSVVLASEDLYGASLELLKTVFGAFGVKTVTADFSDLDSLRLKAGELKPRVILGETISNPLLKVLDVENVAKIARETGAKLIVDNTFATPLLCRPINLGADFVVHSATKFLGGHADATGGVVVAKEDFDRPALMGALTLAGGVLSAWEAHSILRGLKTLGLRLEKQCRNAERLAEFFLDCERVEKVIYPGLADDRQAEIANRILRAELRGAVLGVRLKTDSRADVYRFMNALKLCTRAASVGDIFTGIVHPATATHRELSAGKRARLGISEGLLRVSAGIEEVEDIIADIEQAFEITENAKLKTENKSCAAY